MPRLNNASANSSTVGVPNAYRVNSINLTNYAGVVHDIQALVTDFTISESIYSPTLQLSMNVKDPINFLEELRLSGQETVTLSLSRTPIGSLQEETVTPTFVITEFPMYGKYSNRLQVYMLRGVSQHAFLSKFKRISRSYSGTIGNFIQQVLVKDLGYDPSKITLDPASTPNVKFVVPNLNPLEAISWALRRAFDGTGSPWYCYETLSAGLFIEAQSSMVQSDSYQTYYDGKIFTSDPYTAQDWKDRAQRVTSVASTLNLSKFVSGAKGAWASTALYVDSATKTLKTKTFDYLAKFPSMSWSIPKGPNLSSKFVVGSDALNAYHDATIHYVPINSLAFGKKDINYHSPTEDGTICAFHSYLENFDNIVNDITLMGDFDLCAGNTITLQLHKSLDPTVKVKNAELSNPDDLWDTLLSGIHTVTSVIHRFDDDYNVDVRVKRDASGVQYP